MFILSQVLVCIADLFFVVSMLIYLTTMIFSNVIIVKSGALVRNTLNVIYLFILTSYFGAGLEICLMISAIVGIILNIKKNKSIKTTIDDTTDK